MAGGALATTTRRKNYDQKSPPPSHTTEGSFPVITSDRIENHINPIPIAEFLHPRLKILRCIIDNLVGALLPAHLQFCVGRGCGNHPRPHCLPNLYRCQSNTTCRTKHEQCFTRFKLP